MNQRRLTIGHLLSTGNPNPYHCEVESNDREAKNRVTHPKAKVEKGKDPSIVRERKKDENLFGNESFRIAISTELHFSSVPLANQIPSRT